MPCYTANWSQIINILEANIDTGDPALFLVRSKMFPGYIFVDKVLPRTIIARLSMFIAKDLQYKIIEDKEKQ